MKSLWSVTSLCGWIVLSIVLIRAAFHERRNSARKFVTEGIGVGGHISGVVMH